MMQLWHAAPLCGPNPDYTAADGAARQGYNVARAQSPQQATWVTPAAGGDVKLEYGQGRTMAAGATGGGLNYAYGKQSADGSLTASIQSWLFFEGTVNGGGTAGELARLTDAREKGRIGIFGGALSYAGSYGRVTSESLGRDLNPLGRGDGGSYVAGGPGQTPRGTDCECVSCCRGWGVSYSSQLQTGPAPCEAACDYCHAGAGGSCQDQECACRGCLWDYYNSIGEFQPSRYEVMCEKCCCDGCPCSSGSGGGDGAGSGCPGCGRTGSWGPGDNGGGGGMPGFPPGWGIPGSGVTGPWRPMGESGLPPGYYGPGNYGGGEPVLPPYLEYQGRCRGNYAKYQDPRLRSLLDKLLRCLDRSDNPWAKVMAVNLRNRPVVLVPNLPYLAYCRYGPFSEVIELQNHHFNTATECEIMRTLMHESLHFAWVFWPEWKTFFNDWGGAYEYKDTYGVGINSADTIVSEIDPYSVLCCCSDKPLTGSPWVMNWRFAPSPWRMKEVFMP